MSEDGDEFDEAATPVERPMREPELVRALLDLAARFASAQLLLLDASSKLATGRHRWNQRTHNQLDSEIRIGLREIHTMLDRLPAGRVAMPMPPAEEDKEP